MLADRRTDRRRQGHPAPAHTLVSVSTGGDVLTQEVSFLLLIDYKTTRVDEVQALLSQWIEATGGVRTATRTTVGRDRDDAAHFIEILELPSYEEAVRNSNLHETAQATTPAHRQADYTRLAECLVKGRTMIKFSEDYEDRLR